MPPAKKKMDHVVTGKVYEVTLGKISSGGELFCNLGTHFVAIEDEIFSCLSEQEFLTSFDLRTFKNKAFINGVLVMKCTGKYIVPCKKGKLLRGIIQLADLYTGTHPINFVTFGATQSVIKKTHDKVNHGDWIKLTRFTINVYDGCTGITGDAWIAPISDMSKFDWLKDELVTVPVNSNSAKGQFMSFIRIQIYSVCSVCSRKEENCSCQSLPVVEQRYTVKMLFLTDEKELHEFVAHHKLLKALEKDDEEDEAPPKRIRTELSETVVKKRLGHLLSRPDTEVHWFVSKKEKEVGKKVLTYIS